MAFAQGISSPFDLLKLPELIVKFFPELRIEDSNYNVGEIPESKHFDDRNFSLTATNGVEGVITLIPQPSSNPLDPLVGYPNFTSQL